MTREATELLMIAKDVVSYEVKDEATKKELIRVLGAGGYRKWNKLGTWLVDFHSKNYTTFSNPVLMAAHHVGARMLNYNVGNMSDLWKYFMESETVVNSASLRAMEMFTLDFIKRSGYDDLNGCLFEVKQLIMDVRDAGI